MSTALIIGSTGLVGSHLVQHLLTSSLYETVRSLVRRPTGQVHSKLAESVVSFDDLDDHRDIVTADDVFCAIGTTMRQAGTREAFLKVDRDYAVNTAGLALANGATRFFLISSVGANPASRVFYSRTKGEVEETISRMPYRSVSILRPSFILGERRDARPLEGFAGRIMNAAAGVMAGPLRKYRPIHAGTIARAVVRVAEMEVPGVRVYESDAIASLGAE